MRCLENFEWTPKNNKIWNKYKYEKDWMQAELMLKILKKS